jgi:hypothetical protein
MFSYQLKKKHARQSAAEKKKIRLEKYLRSESKSMQTEVLASGHYQRVHQWMHASITNAVNEVLPVSSRTVISNEGPDTTLPLVKLAELIQEHEGDPSVDSDIGRTLTANRAIRIVPGDAWRTEEQTFRGQHLERVHGRFDLTFRPRTVDTGRVFRQISCEPPRSLQREFPVDPFRDKSNLFNDTLREQIHVRPVNPEEPFRSQVPARRTGESTDMARPTLESYFRPRKPTSGSASARSSSRPHTTGCYQKPIKTFGGSATARAPRPPRRPGTWATQIATQPASSHVRPASPHLPHSKRPASPTRGESDVVSVGKTYWKDVEDIALSHRALWTRVLSPGRPNPSADSNCPTVCLSHPLHAKRPQKCVR